MALKLRNRWKYRGNDWWEWEAFLDDGGSGELQHVVSVEYVLHPTFRNPVREVRDPAGGFRLATGGWGTFSLKAFVRTDKGDKQKLTHELELASHPPEGMSK
jgi:transcription initiation factor IIF auxiliary subunit